MAVGGEPGYWTLGHKPCEIIATVLLHTKSTAFLGRVAPGSFACVVASDSPGTCAPFRHALEYGGHRHIYRMHPGAVDVVDVTGHRREEAMKTVRVAAIPFRGNRLIHRASLPRLRVLRTFRPGAGNDRSLSRGSLPDARPQDW